MSSLLFSTSFAVNAQIWEKEGKNPSTIPSMTYNDASISHSICESVTYKRSVMACGKKQNSFSPLISTSLTYDLVLYEFDEFGTKTLTAAFDYPLPNAADEKHLIPTKVVKKTQGMPGYYVLAYLASNNPITPSNTNNWTGSTTPIVFEFNTLFQLVNATPIAGMDGILLDMEISPLGNLLLSGYEDVFPFQLLSNDRYGIVIKMDPLFNIIWSQAYGFGGSGYNVRFDVIESVHCFMYGGQERYFLSGAATKQEVLTGVPPYPYIYYVPYSLAMLLDNNGNTIWDSYAKRNGMGADAIFDPEKQEIIHLINGFDNNLGISPAANLVTYDVLTGAITSGFVYEGNVTLTSQNNQMSFHDMFNLEIEKTGSEFRIFGLTPELYNVLGKQSTVFGQMHNLVTLNYNNSSRTFNNMLFYPTNTEETFWANPSLIGHLPKESYYDGIVVPSNKMDISLFFSQENSMVWNIGENEFEMSGTYKFGNSGLPQNVASGYFQSGMRLLKSDIASTEACNKNRVVMEVTPVSFTNAALNPSVPLRLYTKGTFDEIIPSYNSSEYDCTSALPPFKP